MNRPLLLHEKMQKAIHNNNLADVSHITVDELSAYMDLMAIPMLWQSKPTDLAYSKMRYEIDDCVFDFYINSEWDNSWFTVEINKKLLTYHSGKNRNGNNASDYYLF